MAKDDFHVIVYQILAYLYQCLKNGDDVDPAMLGKDSIYFAADGMPLSERYWCYVMYQMQRMGLIEGIAFSGKIDNYSFERPAAWDNCMITPTGIEHLTSNSFLTRVQDLLKSVKVIGPFV